MKKWLPVLLLIASANFLAAQDQFGICTNMNTEAISNKVGQLGVRWIRLDIPWDRVEPQQGVFNWRESDQQIARAAVRELNMYITLNGTPRWANGGKESNVPPKDAQHWKDFVIAVARRYRNVPNVKAYGMWNEPNLPEFWKSSQKHYIYSILIPGSQAVKSVSPQLLVAGPELSHHWIDNQKKWNLREILKSAGSHIDVITQHFYVDADQPFDRFLDRYIGPNRMGKAVWITEAGSVACTKKKCSEAEQSRAYIDLLNAQRTRSDWVTKLFPYRMWDPADECGSNGNGFGLTYGDNFQERAAFTTYRDFIQGNPFRDPDPACSPK